LVGQPLEYIEVLGLPGHYDTSGDAGILGATGAGGATGAAGAGWGSSGLGVDAWGSGRGSPPMRSIRSTADPWKFLALIIVSCIKFFDFPSSNVPSMCSLSHISFTGLFHKNTTLNLSSTSGS